MWGGGTRSRGRGLEGGAGGKGRGGQGASGAGLGAPWAEAPTRGGARGGAWAVPGAAAPQTPGPLTRREPAGDREAEAAAGGS